jgi:mannose-6-phosphate isomerase-like protein (cupin superfamily)
MITFIEGSWMYKRNWDEIEPRQDYNGTCLVRDYFRRRDKPDLEGGLKITEYLEWVRHSTIPPDKELIYHRKNVEEILYVLQGEGVLKVGDELFEIRSNDVIYIPPQTPHSIRSRTPHQPLLSVEYAVRDPINSDKLCVELLSEEERGKYNIIVARWTAAEIVSEHHGTCFSWPTIRRESMKYILFATMMSVSGELGYHRHNSEAIYYIDSGRGYVKVAGEEVPVRPGDAIYIPNGVPHTCRTTLREQPLNVFCVGVAIPYDSQVWVEEDLPTKKI